ncbi:hypothetical protein JXR93_12310 [bacterium]|nr:hypothetical protein [bacterium]
MDSSFETLIEEMITQQESKVLRIAREIQPNLTSDDILNPQDFPSIKFDPIFNYEDGILTGMKAVLIALRRELKS